MRVFISTQLNSIMMTSDISEQTTMGELQELVPGSRRALFTKYHIGGCQSCGFDDSETIAEVCQRNGNLPVNEILDHLRTSADHDKKIQIQPKSLKSEIEDTNNEIHLLDIRSREEFEATRIEGTRILTAELQQEALGKWDKNTSIVIIDHVGDRSLDIAAFFIGHGMKNVLALAGGIDAYAQEVDPSIPRYRIEIEAD
jgi:rhodanese-related sulfurtransferase